jgi:pimeloyl-ACP methyl ester carboxylesterase
MILHINSYPRDPETFGSPGRTKLLFLHGMGGNGTLWRPIAATLEDQADILCPDQRGHGSSRTSPGETDFGPLDFAEDVRETCASVGFSPAWVIGHSMGVRTACGYAKLSPDSVLGLVLVDLGFSGAAGGGVGDLLAVFLRDLPSTFASRAEARDFLAKHCPDPAIAQYLLAVAKVDLKTGAITFPFEQESLLKTIEASRGSETGPWMEEFARTTGKPVKVLRGVNSEVYLKEDFEKEQARAAGIPNIEFLEFEGAGHGLPFEIRPKFVELLRKWTGMSAV